MRKQTVKLTHSEKLLPSIKKTRTFTNEGRSIPQSKLDPISLSPRSNMIDNPKLNLAKPRNVFNLKNSNTHLYQKLHSLKQVLETQEEQIRAFEKECCIVNPLFQLKALKPVSSLLDSPPNEIESKVNQEIDDLTIKLIEEKDLATGSNVSIDDTYKNKYKDLEIFRLRKKIEAGNTKISKLSQENEKLNQDLTEYEDLLEITDNCEVEINVIKFSCNQEVHKIYNSITDHEIQLSEILEETREISELLKKSEEKRSYSNEYNIFLESNSEKLRNRIESLQKEKEKILIKIEEIKEKILKKNQEIQENDEKLALVEEEFELQKSKNIEIFTNYEIGKESLEASLQQYEEDRIKYKKEFEKLETQVEDLSNESDSLEKYSASHSMADKIPGFKARHEENLKIKKKLEELCKIKSDLLGELEKLKKNEIYLKNQLITKDLIIKQLENLLEEKEENIAKHVENKKSENTRSPEINELLNIIKPWTERLESLTQELICVSCQSLLKKEIFVSNPCGHLFCLPCKDKSDKCKACNSSIASHIKSQTLHLLVKLIKFEFDFLSKVKRFTES